MAKRSMDSILSDVPTVHDLPESRESATPEPSPEKEARSEPAEKPEPAAAEKATAAPVQKQDTPDDEEQDHVPDNLDGLKKALAAARGDKRKARKQWQETEKKLAELQGRLSVMDQRQQPAGEKPKQFDLNDETFFGQGPEAVKQYVEQRLSAIRDEQRVNRLNYSEAAARERHKDFQEAFDHFQSFAKSNPHLWHQMDASHDPGEFVYRTGKTYAELQGVNSIDDLRSRIEAEVRAKIEAERDQQPAAESQQQQATPPPKSIAGARGTGATPQNWAGRRPFEDVFR